MIYFLKTKADLSISKKFIYFLLYLSERIMGKKIIIVINFRLNYIRDKFICLSFIAEIMENETIFKNQTLTKKIIIF